MTDIPSRLATALQDRYGIEGLAGEGGMATVYRAHDRKHARPVAIKVLRSDLAASLGADRFLREIEIAARLQHPHVLPVYDSGRIAADASHPGSIPLLFYVMPFVEGESLRDRLRREGQLPVGDAIRIGREVASALSYAHRHGVIHRDVKPENIMLSGGHAVVADFGIARALDRAAGGATLTSVGFSVGTPAYMSPEQATASEGVDARSDQYSLAAVVYEMLAGQPAFQGGTVQAVVTSNIAGPRPHVRAVRRAVPEPVERALIRGLATDPAQRFESVEAFAEALDQAGVQARAGAGPLRRVGLAAAAVVALAGAGVWWMSAGAAHGTVVEEASRIAVLPFSARGAGLEVMGEGMVDLISTNLGGVGGIQTVEPRTVLASWKRHGGGDLALEDALAVAAEVRAGAVLKGNAVALGPRVRLSAELYARSGESLAKAAVDGAADSVLGLVDELSLRLLREIWRSNEPIPSLRVSGLTTQSIPALRAYLRGEQLYRRSEYDSAAAAFNQAVEADSTFTLAHFRLAMSYGWIGNYAGAAARQASQAAVRYAGRLPERERKLVIAYQLFQDGKPEATDSMRRYVGSYPEDVDGWYVLGESLLHTRALHGADPATIQEPFERVLALDASLTPAAIHPLELAMAYRDTARFQRYLRVLDAAQAPREAESFRAAERVVWGSGENLDSLYRWLAVNAQQGMMFATAMSAFRQPGATSDTVLARYRALGDALAKTQTNNRPLGVMPHIVAAGLGQVRESDRAADSLMAISHEMGYALKAVPAGLGIATPQAIGRLIASMEKAPRDNPWVRLTLAQFELAQGDPSAAQQHIRAGLAADTTRHPALVLGLLQATDGWRRIIAGDTSGGVAQIERGLLEAQHLADERLATPIRFRWAQALAARPATREAGIRRLEHAILDSEPEYVPMATFTLARTYEAAGRHDDAAAAYGKFIRLWDKADPELRSYVTDARESLMELTGER